jgi:site-specific DNA-methyltransferase (adenine-specific)
MAIKKEVIIGDCRLILGDALEVMPTLDKVNMVLVDPPYGTTACKWDAILPLKQMWVQLKEITEPATAIVMMASQPFTTQLIASNYDMFKYCWVWEKSQTTGFLNAWKMPLKAVEDICIFYERPAVYNPILREKDKHNIRPVAARPKLSNCYGKHKLNVHKCPPDKTMPSNLIKFNNAQNTVHPTQKPVALMEYLINTYTNAGDTVLDFTMGSGTTLVACAKMGRKGIGIELDEDYFNIACKRVADAYKQPDMLIEQPKAKLEQDTMEL